MYIIATSTRNPETQTVHYTSLAGHNAGMRTHMGRVHNGTVLQGYLHACIQGIDFIEAMFGHKIRHKTDILITDPEIAEQFRLKKSLGILHGDDDALWTRFLDARKKLDIRIISHFEESDHLEAVVNWSSVPPQRAELSPVDFPL